NGNAVCLHLRSTQRHLNSSGAQQKLAQALSDLTGTTVELTIVYNVCELGPRGTGKSHVYKECSPNSLLVSGGQTTVANLFYNMA
ncbi:hypothetical protein MJM99_32325, partial [Salmonella enterica subsp. enterica serovar Kentucky]|nr:hypothetical protein [Salmonella enterica subsp. enterica serovar Kentucky]